MRVAGRFDVEHEAGAGGMGIVYRARDRETNERVALKVLRVDSVDGAARFLREAEALRSVAHPAIVRHVAHGVLEDGRPWLAMEWLEGEDLAKRLRRGPLAPALAVSIVRTTAEALAVAHAQSLVHRDVKPANLFLVDGDASRVKVLDFGIARHDRPEHTATATGEMLGTPGYLAPEQARGDRDVDARADLFSLGCVLFECLTGQPAFSGTNVMAVLAKILLDETRRVSDLVDGAPRDLDALVQRLLARDRNARPSDALALVAALDALGPLEAQAILRPAAPRPGISQAERRRVVLALVTPRSQVEAAALALVLPDVVRDGARGADVRVEPLGHGAFAMLMSGLASASELASRAARITLALRERVPSLVVHLATSAAVLDDPIAAVVDRVVQAAHDRVLATDRGSPIYLDDAVVALLGDRYEIERGDHGAELRGPRHERGDSDDATRATTRRTLAVPCLGRERELFMLTAAYDAVVREGAPAVHLVTGAAGAGKSRLRMELATRLRERGDAPVVWTAIADPMETGVPLAVAGRLVRAASGADGAAGRETLAAHVHDIGCDDAARVAEVLGEIAFAPAPSPSPWLVGLRNEPAAMRDQIARAWLAWMEAELRRRRIVVMLEDLHWADAATIKLVDLVLCDLPERPLLVVAFARPEAGANVPRSWSERGLSEIKLGPLPRKAAEEIARRVMGSSASDAAVRDVVAKAGGNAFLLEQLAARQASDDRRAGGDLPDSVLAVVQAGFEGLSADARRVLRAGSVLGERFWTEAVASVLGGVSARVLEGWIDEIVGRRLAEPVELGDSRFPGHPELRFLHALVREAALETLTASDRTLAHGLAAQWLESVGERDALVIARHLEQGAMPERAARAYLAASSRAVAFEDLSGAAAHAEHALSLGLERDEQLRAWLSLAEARSWLGDNAGWQRAAEEALGRATHASEAWWLAARQLVTIAGRKRDRDALESWRDVLIGADAPHDRADVAVRALAAAACGAFGIDARADGWRLVERAEALGLPAGQAPIAHAELGLARGYGYRADGDSARARAVLLDAAGELDAAGDVAQACRARIHAAGAAADVGDATRAAEELRAVVARAGHRLPRLRWAARTVLADALRRAGDLAGSEEQARIALEEASSVNEDLGVLAARATTALLEMKRRND
ncbi:MAG: protein kinase [Deltaproteobacteria bacterium]|nr:protein kinase [Deltaproteobacteria bacterium]